MEAVRRDRELCRGDEHRTGHKLKRTHTSRGSGRHAGSKVNPRSNHRWAAESISPRLNSHGFPHEGCSHHQYHQPPRAAVETCSTLAPGCCFPIPTISGALEDRYGSRFPAAAKYIAKTAELEAHPVGRDPIAHRSGKCNAASGTRELRRRLSALRRARRDRTDAPVVSGTASRLVKVIRCALDVRA